MNISIAPPQVLHELGRRDNQEDALWPPLGEATDATRLFIVCDGMGGHEHGEVASHLVAETLGRFLNEQYDSGTPFSDQLLRDALTEAYNQLDAHDDSSDGRRMGTTLTLLCLHHHGATMAHIGDSRIYHCRPAEQRILYQSRDHSLVMDLYLAGELTRTEADHYEGKNVITRAMQPHLERRCKADIAHTTDLCAGDYFLLCSDGVLERLTNDDLLRLLATTASDEEKCQQLIRLTADNADNHTAYLIRIAEVTTEASDDEAPNDEAASRSNMVILEQQREADTTYRPQPTDTQRKVGWLRRTWNKWFE